MSPEELKKLEPGTKLLVADRFYDGEDNDIRHLLNTVVKFASYDGFGRWLYVEGYPDNALHINEIVGVYEERCLDDESVPYEMGDISALIGSV